MSSIPGQYELNHGYLMMLDGWTNVYDQMPDKEGVYLVENHIGQRGKQRAVRSFGRMAWNVAKWNAYDTCWWKVVNQNEDYGRKTEK